jgi:hypothetical protein
MLADDDLVPANEIQVHRVASALHERNTYMNQEDLSLGLVGRQSSMDDCLQRPF